MLFNQNGFGYIQLITGGSITLAISLIIYESVINSNKLKNWIGNNESFDQEIHFLTNYFKDRDICTQTINSFDYTDTGSVTVGLNKISSHPFSVVDFALPSELSDYSGNVDLLFHATGSLGYDKIKKVNLHMSFDTSGNLTDCYSNLSSDFEFNSLRATLCQDLGAVYNAASSTCLFEGVDFSYAVKGSCPARNGVAVYEPNGEFHFCTTGSDWVNL